MGRQSRSVTTLAMTMAIMAFLDNGCFSRNLLVAVSPIASPAPSLAPSAAPSEIDPRTTRETRFVGESAMLLMLSVEAVEWAQKSGKGIWVGVVALDN
jgi:hypothetical protein